MKRNWYVCMRKRAMKVLQSTIIIQAFVRKIFVDAVVFIMGYLCKKLLNF